MLTIHITLMKDICLIKQLVNFCFVSKNLFFFLKIYFDCLNNAYYLQENARIAQIFRLSRDLF